MSIISAFQPIGQSFIINTNAAPSTSQATLVSATALNIPTDKAGIPTQQPTQMRIINSGTTVIWFNTTATSTVIAIPVAGTVTVGTPGLPTWAFPNLEITMTMNAGWTSQGAGVYGFYINTISTVATQPLWVTLGEGL
jgi:hypothetical protein